MASVPEWADSVIWPNMQSMQRSNFRSCVQHQTTRWGIAALLCQALVAGAASTGDLATLFYSPLERQAISAGRRPLPTDDAVADVAVTTQLNGIVRRAGGKGTVWVNDKPVPENTPPAGKIQALSAVIDGRRMRVGESVDRISGARTDVVAPGAVRLQIKP
jgi:hypothetical protein